MNIEKLKKKVINDPFYSIRRFYVDLFFFDNLTHYNKDTIVIDIGGKRKGKRGVFDCDEIFNSVINVNLSPSSIPEILADANFLPIRSKSCTLVICSEFLEHVLSPDKILEEIYRILKPGGRLFITVPFMFEVHADPYDIARYTDYYWKICLKESHFDIVSIQSQGSIYAVIAHVIKTWYKEHIKSDPTFHNRKILFFLIKLLTRYLLNKELNYQKSLVKVENFRNSTLGFEIIAIKPK